MVNTQFYYTKKVFSDYLNYSQPYTYEQWLQLPVDDKAAALFVQFYNQIYKAYLNTHTDYCDVEDAIECVIQYLQKNVDKIIQQPQRFVASYIYTVAYNCLYVINYDVKSSRQRCELTISNVQYTDGNNEFDLFDILPCEDNCLSWYDEMLSNKFWEYIENIDNSDEFLTYVYKTISPNVGVYRPSDTVESCRSVRLTPKLKERCKQKLVEAMQDIPISLTYGYVTN